MKKIIFIAVVCLTLAACSITEIKEDTRQTGKSFEKGQLVTITVLSPATTKATSSTDATGTVSFKWESGDSVKVSVGINSEIFKVSKLIGGGTSAEFTGTMPSGGSTFDVQFPVTEPDLSEQSYISTEAIPHNMMLFKAEDCSIEAKSFSLTAVNASLRLNLYGESQTISKIDVKDGSSNTYTLGINPAVTLPTTKADSMAFYIVVPTGTYKFSAEVFNNDATPVSICKFQTTNAQTFVAAQILDMPAKKVAISTGGDPQYAR